ncbi:MAG: cation diffusion facilitator family transporter [Myxococcota bacterium]
MTQAASPTYAPRSPRLALGLVIGTLAYNVIEAGIALWSGASAGSSALVGFGLDSVIESAAAGVLLWRLWVEARGADPETVEASEVRVLRFVGGTFLALALYVTVEAGLTLWWAEAPRQSPVGIGLAGASLVIMPGLAWAKLREADRLGSGALRAEAKETLACSYLSFALLLGLVLNAAAGLWWADPAAALAMVPWLVREGLEGLRGETCEDGAHG